MKRMSGVLVAAVALLSVSIIFFACSGSRKSSGSGPVAVYVTDDVPLTSDPTGTVTEGAEGEGIVLNTPYSQATMTIETIQLVDTASGSACDLVTASSPFDFAHLGEVVQFVNVSDCPAAAYDRLHVAFDATISLSSVENGIGGECTFVDYGKGGDDKPNVVHCNEEGECWIDINGAVQVLADESNKTVLGFSAKELEVTGLGTSDCTVTMKVSPLTPGHVAALKKAESIKGLVSNINREEKTFDLTRGNKIFTVRYSDLATTDLEEKLAAAEEEGSRTRVTCDGINLMDKSLVATGFVFKAK